MDSLTSVLVGYLLIYKYYALFAVTFLGALALPIPSSSIITISAGLAAEGKLNIFAVFIVGFLGNVLGDVISYWVARKYGKGVFYFFGFRWLIDSSKFKSLEGMVDRHPGWYVTISRYEGFANICVNVIAGIAKVPFLKFLFFDILGESLQVATYCILGYEFGDQWQKATSTMGKVLLIAVAVGLLTALTFRKQLLASLTIKKK